MSDLWGMLLPLVRASALEPIQLTVTILLLRSSVAAAAGWAAGMSVARLLQGMLFGLVFNGAGAEADSSAARHAVASVVLLVLGVLLIVMAARTLLREPDEDVPPPAWMRINQSVAPLRAAAFGALYVAVAPKLWVFTLGAITAVRDTEPGVATAIVAFLVFALLAVSLNLAVVGYAVAGGESSQRLLELAAGWLERRGRGIKIVVGLVFGTWFVLQALGGLGVL